LPDQDPPEIFGMHSNADIAYQRNLSDLYCTIILITQSEDSGDDEGGSDTDKIVSDIITNFLGTLPELLLRSVASKSVKERNSDGMISIYTTFL